MKKPRALMMRIGIAVAIGAVGFAAATTASASAQAAHHQLAKSSVSLVNARAAEHATQALKTASPDQAYDNCTSGYYCDYAGTNGSDLCLEASVSLPNWGDYGCRNVDESFANRTSGLVRLYYSPDYQGAWVCIDASKYSNNLAPYTFNNGSSSAGYGAPLENDVASSSTASGNCTNPLPLP
jgi:hypothetical protein